MTISRLIPPSTPPSRNQPTVTGDDGDWHFTDDGDLLEELDRLSPSDQSAGRIVDAVMGVARWRHRPLRSR